MVRDDAPPTPGTIPAPSPQNLDELWEAHLRAEFADRSADAAVATMVEDAYVNHVPVLTGGRGCEELRAFYRDRFIAQMPPDTEITPVTRTIGADRLVGELIFSFTHTIRMDWILPGVPPTGKRVEVPMVVLVEFRDGKLASERIYWDQASVLVQLGLLDPATLPIAGVEAARKVLDPSLGPNELIHRFDPAP